MGLFEIFFFFIQIVKGLRGFSEIGGSVDRAPECIGSGPAIASTVHTVYCALKHCSMQNWEPL